MGIVTYDTNAFSAKEIYSQLVSAIAPRPIAFASTVDKAGNVNLSPFSFFNVFGALPPTLIFAPTRSMRTGETKNTLDNVREVPEVVINIVNYGIVEQMSLASTAYEKGVNEFVKSGLTEVASQSVKPPRVKESPVSIECIVRDIYETGKEGGAGSLVICEVKVIHVEDEYLDEEGNLDSTKLDLVARMGGNWYCRAKGEALFEIPKPIRNKGIGIDLLPAHVRNSDVLSGNNLGRLGNSESLPAIEEIERFKNSEEYKSLSVSVNREIDFHKLAKEHIENGRTRDALIVLCSV